jgi:hypothetical protein
MGFKDDVLGYLKLEHIKIQSRRGQAETGRAKSYLTAQVDILEHLHNQISQMEVRDEVDFGVNDSTVEPMD